MTNLVFSEHLSRLREIVDGALVDCLARAPWPPSLKAAVEYSLMAGGKRLRPILVLLANEVCGGRTEDSLAAACAIEMIHTYSLIHDDLPAMDDDDFRRGHPTSHKVFGEALAILAGDCLLTFAFETIAAASLDASRTAQMLQILSTAAGGTGMVGGQVLDMEAERGSFCKASPARPEQKSVEDPSCNSVENAVKPDLNAGDSQVPGDTVQSTSLEFRQNEPNRTADNRVGELSQIHKMKTGALIAAALELGAVSAASDLNHRSHLRHYGLCIGLAFQIADDLLDVTGDQSKLGKKPGRDADLGKLTYPGLLGIDSSRLKAQQLVQEACDAVDVFGERSVWLKDLARFIVERDH